LEDRMAGNPAVRLDMTPHLSVQLGCLNSGCLPTAAAISDLRISRRARYTEDFTPPTAPLTVDEDTAVLFTFNGDLTGHGRLGDETYELHAVPGVLAWP
jgi:hypothetical protein